MDQIYHDVAGNLFRVTVTRLLSLEELLATMPQELIHQTFGQFGGGPPKRQNFRQRGPLRNGSGGSAGRSFTGTGGTGNLPP